MSEKTVKRADLSLRLSELDLFILTSFFFLGIVDSFLTYVGVSIGLTEGNIFIASIIRHSWALFFIFKFAVALFMAAICYRLKNRLLPSLLA